MGGFWKGILEGSLWRLRRKDTYWGKGRSREISQEAMVTIQLKDDGASALVYFSFELVNMHVIKQN